MELASFFLLLSKCNGKPFVIMNVPGKLVWSQCWNDDRSRSCGLLKTCFPACDRMKRKLSWWGFERRRVCKKGIKPRLLFVMWRIGIKAQALSSLSLSIQRYRCHLFRFRGLLSRRWVDCGNSERTGAALCLKGSDWPPYRHSFITGNGLNTWREEQSRPSVQGFCSLILSQDLRGSCSHCWLAKLNGGTMPTAALRQPRVYQSFLWNMRQIPCLTGILNS